MMGTGPDQSTNGSMGRMKRRAEQGSGSDGVGRCEWFGHVAFDRGDWMLDDLGALHWVEFPEDDGWAGFRPPDGRLGDTLGREMGFEVLSPYLDGSKRPRTRV